MSLFLFQDVLQNHPQNKTHENIIRKTHFNFNSKMKPYKMHSTSTPPTKSFNQSVPTASDTKEMKVTNQEYQIYNSQISKISIPSMPRHKYTIPIF